MPFTKFSGVANAGQYFFGQTDQKIRVASGKKDG
jgi:hypothetical protein